MPPDLVRSRLCSVWDGRFELLFSSSLYSLLSTSFRNPTLLAGALQSFACRKYTTKRMFFQGTVKMYTKDREGEFPFPAESEEGQFGEPGFSPRSPQRGLGLFLCSGFEFFVELFLHFFGPDGHPFPILVNLEYFRSN